MRKKSSFFPVPSLPGVWDGDRSHTFCHLVPVTACRLPFPFWRNAPTDGHALNRSLKIGPRRWLTNRCLTRPTSCRATVVATYIVQPAFMHVSSQVCECGIEVSRAISQLFNRCHSSGRVTQPQRLGNKLVLHPSDALLCRGPDMAVRCRVKCKKLVV